MKPFSFVLLIGCVALLVGLMAYGRGSKHHHGDDLGSHGVKIALVRAQK